MNAKLGWARSETATNCADGSHCSAPMATPIAVPPAVQSPSRSRAISAALRIERLQPEVDEVAPADDDPVDDDVGAAAQADPCCGARQQEAVPPADEGSARRQPVQCHQRPRQCGGGCCEVDVDDLRADETSQPEACPRQHARERPAARPPEEQLAPDSRRRQYDDLSEDPCRQRGHDREHECDGQERMGVRATEERSPRPQERIPEGEVAMAEDLARQLLEGIVLGEIVARDERITGGGSRGEEDGREAGEQSRRLPVRHGPARSRYVPDRGHARS